MSAPEHEVVNIPAPPEGVLSPVDVPWEIELTDKIEFEAFDGPPMPETVVFEAEALTPAEVARIEAAISHSDAPPAPARKSRRRVPRVFLGPPGDPRNGNY